MSVVLPLLAGCAAPAQPAPITPCPAPPPVTAAPVAVAPPAPTAPAVATNPLPTCSKGLEPAPDGLFDDFEDGTSQVALEGGRNGYWWIAKAPHATVDVPGPEFRISDGGPEGSKRAAHVAGKTDEQDEWGFSLGGNFSVGGFYDASKYAGVSFKIKGTPKSFVRFKVHDVNTHPDGGVCHECWNAFGKTLQLNGEWQTFELSFAELRQLDGWGSPHPPNLTSSKVKHLEWAVDQGTPFDFWIDDVKLLVCK
ncbi:MAG TPA: carbohydrate binding domain-containing protein [Polyangiaceae bacterium]|nr:carbohydrate binding domain-containing protein [Polyangiaceae bacterium]